MTTTAAQGIPEISFSHENIQSMAEELQIDSTIQATVLPTHSTSFANKPLIFVHLNEITGPTQDIKTRNKVRAHVMRDFQRKKRDTARDSKAKKSSSLSSLKPSLVELDDQGAEALMKETSSDFIPASMMALVYTSLPGAVGSMEPFNALPIPGSPRLHTLMCHYNNVLLKTLIPVNPKDKWMNYVITDAALFQGTMIHSAMHQRLVTGGIDPCEQEQLKRDTITMLNKRLGDPVFSRDDGTIGAVVCLILLANQEVNPALCNIHMKGLQKMIALRGGIDNLGLAGVLRRKVLWGDILNAAISRTEPLFNLTPTAAHPTTDFPFTPSTSNLPDHDQATTLWEGGLCTCTAQFSTILTHLRSISHLPNLETNTTGELSDSIYLAERHLCYLTRYVRDSSLVHSATCRTIGEACCSAGQMYLYHTLRDFPFEIPVFQMFFQRLDECLFSNVDKETGRVGVMWEGKERMLVWVLCLGALASIGREDMRRKYVLEVKRVCDVLGITSLCGFVELLNSVVWRDAGGDLKLVALWNEAYSGMFETLRFEELELGI
ncbi:hypothetical protein VTL71DRAFT_7937 [Oculimacula yallundae]|uniref:C6 transcription factor n=1 Tax=Oculimacula yallundae TaxID=86028 RepID=A0ABR4CW67_9HELO